MGTTINGKGSTPTPQPRNTGKKAPLASPAQEGTAPTGNSDDSKSGNNLSETRQALSDLTAGVKKHWGEPPAPPPSGFFAKAMANRVEGQIKDHLKGIAGAPNKDKALEGVENMAKWYNSKPDPVRDGINKRVQEGLQPIGDKLGPVANSIQPAISAGRRLMNGLFNNNDE